MDVHEAIEFLSERIDFIEREGYQDQVPEYYAALKIAVKNLRRTIWRTPAEALPDSDEKYVLVQISGKPRQNIYLENAIELATYDHQSGWIIDAYPEWDNAQPTAWMPLPDEYKEDEA